MQNQVVIKDLQLDKVCRVCLEENSEMLSVFSEFSMEDNLEDISFIYEILMTISNMKIFNEDGFPTSICSKCLDLAHTSFKFQQKCNHSQTILEAYFAQTSVPIEDEQVVKEENFTDIKVFFEMTASTDEDATEDQVGVVKEIDVDTKQETADLLPWTEVLDKQEVVTSTVESKSPNYVLKVNEYGEKAYKCNLCDKSYKFCRSLKVHLASHSEERRYVCNLCNKAFKQYRSLSYHKQSHSGVQPYVCKICGKRYRQSGTLTAHMRIHTGHRPYLCSICGKGFRQRSDLNYHMRSHTKEKPYMCNICGKTMSMQCHLVQHMRVHTGERPYKCEKCSKAFPSSTRLKRHAIIHTGLKPYKCDVCSKSFNRASSLKVHAKIHTDERPHACPVCGKRFIQAHTLKSHMLTHVTAATS